MRERFTHPGSVPPIPYMYEHSYEGETYQFHAPTRLGIKQTLRQWYVAKGLDYPGDKEIDSRLEHFMCQFLPPGFCTDSGRKRTKFLSVPMIRDATQLIVQRISKGDKTLVPPEEATRRAKICANCPQNLHGICTTCAGNDFLQLFAWFLRRGRTTEYDSVLDTCKACGCLLRAKVHVALDVLTKLETHVYPSNCWLHNTSCNKKAVADPEAAPAIDAPEIPEA